MANNLREMLREAAWPDKEELTIDAALSVIRKWLESEEAASAANFAFGQALIDQLHLVPSNDGAAQTRSIVSHSDRLVGMSAALKSLSANLEGTGE